MNPYINDIFAQPQALRATLDALQQAPDELTRIAAQLRAGRFKRVVLTGMGGSYSALHPLWITLVQAGYAPLLVETSELIYNARSLLDAETLLVIVSQSGRSAEIIRLLNLANGATVLAITNTAESALALRAHCALVTRAGEEATVSCKTWVCALAALALTGAALVMGDWPAAWDELAEVIPAVDFYISQLDVLSERIADLVTSNSLVLCGRGASLAAAQCGALIVKEAAQVHAEGMGSAQFRHGPMELAATGLCVFVFEGVGDGVSLNHKLVHDATAAGGHAYLVGPHAEEAVLRLPAVDPIALPILEVLPAQMLSVGLARRKGHEPGNFKVNTKVTATE